MKKMKRIIALVLFVSMLLICAPSAIFSSAAQKSEDSALSLKISLSALQKKNIDPAAVDKHFLGDFHSDFVIDTYDARIALRKAVSLEKKLLDYQIFLMDIDQDDMITTTDARKILRVAVGLESCVIIFVVESEEEAQEESFTVSFDSNYEGAEGIPSQIVKKAEKAIAPNDPVREGYQFAGWRITSALGELYDFDTPVLSDIVLVAAWTTTGSDDANDEIDDSVEEEDTYILSANQNEVLANSAATVIFNVNSTVSVPYFELLLEDSSTGVYLYDDGNYSDHADDIPNDGCYSGVYTIELAEENHYGFTAVATVGDAVITTNEYYVFVYSAITEEETELMESVENGLTYKLQEVRANNSELEEDTLIQLLKTTATEYLIPYEENGIIANVIYSENSFSFHWDYPDVGVDTHYFIYEKENEIRVKNTVTKSVSAKTAAPAEEIYTGDIYSKGKVAILNYFPNGDSDNDCYDEVSETLSDAGFSVTNVYSFTCASFKYLQEYNSLILINSHGNTLDSTEGGIPCICTDEHQSAQKNKEYSADINQNRIERVTLSSGENVYWIRPELFNFYYSENKLNGPIVYLGCCRNYPDGNTQMVKEWSKAGADATLGYNASVSFDYDHEMVTTLTEELIKGNNVSDAVSTAKKLHQTRDPHTTDSDWHKKAELKIFDGSAATLYHKLLNGQFDDSSTGNIISGWQKYGDARTIYKLSGLTPISSPKMTIISSGFGSQNGQKTSCLYQTILVPNEASELSFSYDVVSEEPMEYVGSIYNDIFQVDILDTSGHVLKTLLTESVNTSNWYAIDGIDFPNGDQTTYHTRWTKFGTNAISQFQNQLIVLRFSVQDAGDAVYDTAALIDSVSIHLNDVSGGGSGGGGGTGW